VKIERTITVIDNKSMELIDEINIDYIDLEDLKEIFSPSVDDPFMYKVYEIKPDMIPAIKGLLKDYVALDLMTNVYYMTRNRFPSCDAAGEDRAASSGSGVGIVHSSCDRGKGSLVARIWNIR